MFEPAEAPAAAAEPVVYEQPLNERMRVFLRLEFLWNQAVFHSSSPSPWSSRAAVGSLLEILANTARGDRAATCSRNSGGRCTRCATTRTARASMAPGSGRCSQPSSGGARS